MKKVFAALIIFTIFLGGCSKMPSDIVMQKSEPIAPVKAKSVWDWQLDSNGWKSWITTKTIIITAVVATVIAYQFYKIREYKQTIKQQADDLIAANQQIANLNADNQLLNAEDHQQQIANLNANNQQQAVDLNAANQQIANLNANNQQQAVNLNAANQQIANLNANNQQQAADLNAANQQIANLNAAYQQQINALDLVNRKYKDQEAEFNRCHQEVLNRLNESLKEFDSLNAAHQNKVQELEELNIIYQQQGHNLENLNADNQNKVHELEVAFQQVAELNAAYQNKVHELEELNAARQQQGRNLEDLTVAHQNKVQEFGVAFKQVRVLKKKLHNQKKAFKSAVENAEKQAFQNHFDLSKKIAENQTEYVRQIVSAMNDVNASNMELYQDLVAAVQEIEKKELNIIRYQQTDDLDDLKIEELNDIKHQVEFLTKMCKRQVAIFNDTQSKMIALNRATYFQADSIRILNGIIDNQIEILIGIENQQKNIHIEGQEANVSNASLQEKIKSLDDYNKVIGSQIEEISKVYDDLMSFVNMRLGLIEGDHSKWKMALEEQLDSPENANPTEAQESCNRLRFLFLSHFSSNHKTQEKQDLFQSELEENSEFDLFFS
jgi:chromosome segregation ATPase